jgi:hypothetical protein
MTPDRVVEYLSADPLNGEYAEAVRALIAERDRLRATLERAAVWLNDDYWGTVWMETPEFFGEHFDVKSAVNATLNPETDQ